MRHAARVRMPLTAADCALAEILELMAYMHPPRQSRALCEMWRCVVCVWLPWATIGHAAERLASQDRPPNVVLLISDDQRSDTIHAWGNPQIRTPHLDRLVSSGCSFLRATCANPICTPSRGEIMTGVSGFRNGIRDFGRQRAPGVRSWAEQFRDAGFRTVYVGKWHNHGRPRDWGYQATRGLFASGGGRWAVPTFDWNGKPVTGYRGWVFQSADRQYFPERGVGLTSDISTDFADAALQFLKTIGKQRFFLHVNFTAPHDPLLMPIGHEHVYDPEQLKLPANFRAKHPFDHGNLEGRDERLFDWPRTSKEVRREMAVYYSVITHMDQQIGRILDGLVDSGQAQHTIVVFASDHGLAIGSHGLRGKQNMYEHTIGVPLIISGPGIPKDKRIRSQCYLRDLFPTICQLSGVDIPAGVEGRSLVPALQGDDPPIYREIFGYFRDAQRMIRGDRWKLIEYPGIHRFQLFDLEQDPYEVHDLAEDRQHAARLRELRARLRAWQVSVRDPLING